MMRRMAVGAIALVGFLIFSPSVWGEAIWGPWLSDEEKAKLPYDAGFSNLELGGYLDFQYACETAAAGRPLVYWSRFNRLWATLGTGTMEIVCGPSPDQPWSSYSATAIRSDLPNPLCVRVQVPGYAVLRIREESSVNSPVVGAIASGTSLTIPYSPASIDEAEGRYWLAIERPRSGWISLGTVTQPDNLALCHGSPLPPFVRP